MICEESGWWCDEASHDQRCIQPSTNDDRCKKECHMFVDNGTSEGRCLPCEDFGLWCYHQAGVGGTRPSWNCGFFQCGECEEARLVSTDEGKKFVCKSCSEIDKVCIDGVCMYPTNPEARKKSGEK